MKCKCKAECEAVAVGGEYASGHNPASHVWSNSNKNSDMMRANWKNADFRKKVMATRQRTMYSNPLWKKKAGKLNKGRRPWNFGLTRKNNSSLAGTSRAVKKQWKLDVAITKKRMASLKKVYKSSEWIKKVYGKVGYYSGKSGRIYMRSSWEIAFAKWCDRRGIAWEYEPKTFLLGKRSSYRPDFYLKEQKYWVEIKGYLTEIARRKIVAFCNKFRPRFILLRKRELSALGVIT